jgi:DNA-directed RNA polymerase subunit RPC12/RpoP
MKYDLSHTELALSEIPKGTPGPAKTYNKWKDPAFTKDRERRRHLQRFYGITLEEFEARFKAQDYKCACCGRDTTKGKGWHIDHDHVTKKIRGILCNGCNVSIGINGDTVESVQEAFENQLAYLKRANA